MSYQQQPERPPTGLNPMPPAVRRVFEITATSASHLSLTELVAAELGIELHSANWQRLRAHLAYAFARGWCAGENAVNNSISEALNSGDGSYRP